MNENSNETEPVSVFHKIVKTPGKIRKIVAVAFIAAAIGGMIPTASLSVGAQDAVYANTTACLNLRTGAGTSYSVSKVLDKNVTVTVIDKSLGNWIRVKLSDGTVGYCSADYLDIITDAQTDTYLNIRKGAGLEYGIIKTVAPGVKLDIIKFCGKNWAQVQLSDGTKGYVCTDYLTYLSNTATKTTVSSNVQVSQEPLSASKPTTNTASISDKITISLTSKTLGIGKNVTLTAKATSGGAISYTSANKNIATVTSKGVVTAVKTGTTVITATDSKTGKKVSCSIKVVKEGLTSVKIAETSKTLTVNDTYTITAATVPANGEVEYTTSNKNVATVTAKGVVKAVAKGTAKITVADPAGTAKAVLTVTVKEPTTIKLSDSSVSIKLGANYTIKATTSDNSSISWSSSDTNVAAVRKGVVSALSPGTVTITAKDSTGKISASCKVTVTSLPSSGVSLSRYSAKTTAGKTIYIKGYSSRYAEWGTSNSLIATVRDGFICTKAAGEVAITYTDYNGNRAVCVVTVKEADPIKFTYSSPNSAVLNSNVKLVAITDKTRTDVKFVVNANGKNVVVKASEKKSEGDTYVWTGIYRTTVAGTLTYKAYSYKNSAWSTSTDGAADIYVTTKTDHKTTSLEKLRASDDVIRFIGEKEGFVSSITYDELANNIPTLGHGYVVWEGDCFYDNLTRSEAYALLVSAVNKEVYARKVNEVLLNNNVRFNQQQFDALVSFSYNLGTGWTSSSDLKNILLNSYGPVSDGSTVTGYVNSNCGLNLRKSYTTNSDVIRVLNDGERVTLVSTTKYNSVWYKVKTSDGTVGYCSGTYLTLSSSGKTERDLNYVNKNSLINELLAYHHACGVCYYGLLYRRCDELEMFLYGDYDSDGYMNYHNFPSPYCLSF